MAHKLHYNIQASSFPECGHLRYIRLVRAKVILNKKSKVKTGSIYNKIRNYHSLPKSLHGFEYT